MRPGPGWLGVALALSLGALGGVLATLALGGGRSARVTTITIPAPLPEDTRLAAKTAVPSVIGQPPGAARDRLLRAGFLMDVQGAGPLRLLLQRGWRVEAQVPRPGAIAPTGTTVQVLVARG